MKVLVVGNGGREHAIAWKLAQSADVHAVCVAPGNGGTGRTPKMSNVAISATDIPALIDYARDNQVDLTVIGPEAPLVAGVVDSFEAAGLRCFGPNRAASQLEGSKAFTKDFLARHNIPTAAYEVFTETQPALNYVERIGAPLVVKADGLAAGKGVVIAHSVDEAKAAVRNMLDEGEFGDAGAQIVIEQFLTGEEASFIAIVDGDHILPLASSQDHKARDDGDEGPNTGGMGAYSPAPVVTHKIHERIMAEVIRPTVAGLQADGIRYRGFLYAGLMITDEGEPQVLEFNCRLGDPETQPILMRLKSDLLELLQAAIDGRLNEVCAEWDQRVALAVVMASGGYPGDYDKGLVIDGILDRLPSSDVRIFHAGTRSGRNGVVTDGGRVLSVCALGDGTKAAQAAAYEVVNSISWEGSFYRHDIGYRAVAREEESARGI